MRRVNVGLVRKASVAGGCEEERGYAPAFARHALQQPIGNFLRRFLQQGSHYGAAMIGLFTW